MKKLIFSWLLSVLFFSTTYAQYGTARTGYEGDYFSLEGALDLFKQSYTLREFERKLNTEENWVNNLDLNYDGRVDYIRVEHRQQGNYHAIILQRQQSRSTTTRSRATTRSTPPARKPSASSRRSEPTSKSKATRSTTSKRSSSKSGSRRSGGAEF